MKYATVCSGIEACSVAWEPLGWKPAFFSEIEKFPKAVLAHHYPDVPDLGDMTKLLEDERSKESIDLICGGTPCQSFSIAGLRKGLDDPRGNLALEFLKIVDQLRPTWVVWENVPGVLSSSGGRDFGSFITALGQLGYGWAYRVLNAQYFGVPQRRRRVFVVGHINDYRRAAAVLFERACLQGDFAPKRKAGKETTGGTNEGVAKCLTRTGPGSRNLDPETSNLIFKIRNGKSGGGKGFLGNTETAYTISSMADQYVSQVYPTLDASYNAKRGSNQWIDSGAPIIQKAFTQNVFGIDEECNVRHDQFGPLLKGGQRGTRQAGFFTELAKLTVRRLMPIEAERLQGFADNYTQIPYRNKPADKCPDSPRYKALGNSMAVPVMRWIGERIQMVNEI